MTQLAKLSRSFYCTKAISLATASAKRFSSVPDFDALAEKVQQWKEKTSISISDNNNEISSADEVIESREWLK